MYRYRKFQLSDTQSVLVRTEVHGAQQRSGKAEPVQRVRRERVVSAHASGQPLA